MEYVKVDGDKTIEFSADEGEPPSVRPLSPFAPMLATRVKEPFSRKGWVFEPKYDGWRLVALGARARSRSRPGASTCRRSCQIVKAVTSSGGDLVLDGEMVVLDDRGVASFRLLQERNETGAQRPCSSSSTVSS